MAANVLPVMIFHDKTSTIATVGSRRACSHLDCLTLEDMATVDLCTISFREAPPGQASNFANPSESLETPTYAVGGILVFLIVVCTAIRIRVNYGKLKFGDCECYTQQNGEGEVTLTSDVYLCRVGHNRNGPRHRLHSRRHAQ